MPQTRTHKIILVKPQAGAAGYGFSIRGGVEHRIGIYVSEVEVGGEAHMQGLQPGDQILKICGVPLTSATHKEAVALITGRSRLELKVSSGGVIPVKVRRSEPVSWSRVNQEQTPETRVTHVSGDSGDPGQYHSDTVKTVKSVDSDLECPEMKMSINLVQGQGLGCSICKVRIITILSVFLSHQMCVCGSQR